jgi:hypothetical protein
MLAKNIVAVLAFVFAASASPAGLERRNPTCNSDQTPVCCDSILNLVGVGCGKANPDAYKIYIFEDNANVNQWWTLPVALPCKSQVAAATMDNTILSTS